MSQYSWFDGIAGADTLHCADGIAVVVVIIPISSFLALVAVTLGTR